MGHILKLSDELANQIAAGEVVERPASIVKELVENSLDANATRIVVDVERGGVTLVRVTDDGDGMTPDDALLALERHATSKLKALEDLFHLGTFGFRGEALPSIASVSRLLLRTRARSANEGCEIEVTAGQAPVVRPAGGAIGTSIEVRDLFFNVPARRKFLKATGTESAHIGDVLLSAALARPDVTFVLTREGRAVREYLRVGSRSERARDVHPGDNLVHVVAAHDSLRIEAMLGAPEKARSGATGLTLLVNGRPVRDRVLARAVAHAYGSVLEAGRYPVGVVWIDLPPELVDINVHPQKAEVRFSDARGVFDAITRELHSVLARAFGLPELSHPFAQPRPATPPALLGLLHRSPSAPRERDTPQLSYDFSRLNARPTPLTTAHPTSSSPASFQAPAEVAGSPPRELLSADNLFLAESPSNTQAPSGEGATTTPASGLFSRKNLYGTLRFIGQAHGTFLLCEGEDGLYVLDQHAAAERVNFDRLRRSFASRTITMQRLLVPELVELPPSDVAMLEERADDVSRLGVEVRAVGEGTVAVHALPTILAGAEPTRVVRDLTSELSRAGGRAFGGAVDLVLATMACHGSIRAGDAISTEEVHALLTALDEVDFAGHCPHGRPVVMRLGWNELERRVGR